MQQERQIFTPENIRGFIGRKVIVTDVTGLECHEIKEASLSGYAARLSLLHPAAVRTSWWELAKLNQKFYDFAPDDKPAKVYASPIDELMDGFFAEMRGLGITTVLNQPEGARGPIDTSFNFSVDGKEHTDETIHEILEKRFGVPFRLSGDLPPRNFILGQDCYVAAEDIKRGAVVFSSDNAGIYNLKTEAR